MSFCFRAASARVAPRPGGAPPTRGRAGGTRNGAGHADGLRRMDDVGRQLEARGEGFDELVRLAIVLEILPALGRSPDDELQEHVKRRQPRHIDGSPMLPGVRALVQVHGVDERRLRHVLRVDDGQRDLPDLAFDIVDAEHVPCMS